MPTWNDLYLEKNNIPVIPQVEVYRFVKKLENQFVGTRLTIWDLCCGAGRHTVFLSKLGFNVYGSDESENGLSHLQNILNENNLKAELKKCDMTEKPWNNDLFHGVICWDSLHHNTIENIEKAEENVYKCVKKDGLFLLNVMSTKSDGYGKGKEVERNTFVFNEGVDSGVPHHYFDIEEIKKVFVKWKFLILSEQINNYIETEFEFYKTNPYSYTKWNLLLKK